MYQPKATSIYYFRAFSKSEPGMTEVSVQRLSSWLWVLERSTSRPCRSLAELSSLLRSVWGTRFLPSCQPQGCCLHSEASTVCATWLIFVFMARNGGSPSSASSTFLACLPRMSPTLLSPLKVIPHVKPDVNYFEIPSSSTQVRASLNK